MKHAIEKDILEHQLGCTLRRHHTSDPYQLHAETLYEHSSIDHSADDSSSAPASVDNSLTAALKVLASQLATGRVCGVKPKACHFRLSADVAAGDANHN